MLVDLLAMTPSNHRRLTELALANKGWSMLSRLGLTK